MPSPRGKKTVFFSFGLTIRPKWPDDNPSEKSGCDPRCHSFACGETQLFGGAAAAAAAAFSLSFEGTEKFCLTLSLAAATPALYHSCVVPSVELILADLPTLQRKKNRGGKKKEGAACLLRGGLPSPLSDS